MDLSLASFDDLWDELSSRFDHAVFIGSQEAGDEHRNLKQRYNGDPLILLGLISVLQSEVLCTHEETMIEDEED